MMQARLCMHDSAMGGLNTIISIAAKPLADVRNNAHRCVPCILSPEPGGSRSISFVPGAFSIHEDLCFWYDNPCSDKALRFWQLASVVSMMKRRPTRSICVISVAT